MSDGRRRVVIGAVTPEVDHGRFPAKRTVGERVDVEADIYTDGHDKVASVVRFRQVGAAEWSEAPLAHMVNDRWAGSFIVTHLGRYDFQVVAWVDRFGTWVSDLRKRVAADDDVSVDLKIGAELVAEVADCCLPENPASELLHEMATELADPTRTDRVTLALDPKLLALMAANDPRRFATETDGRHQIEVDPVRARHSTWYEVFPRSTSQEPDRHGTFADVETWLPYIAGMGFDVLYLPPIHPIGVTARKGRNNHPKAEPGDVGSPWAIGSAEGGHKSIHPDLGTFEDFDHLVAAARDQGVEVALDIAFQCSPDHPYVTEHPEWFRHRPDGTIQYAENPPKKYQDIYPFDFECEAWESLWEELLSVVRFWMGHGVRTFRVDNPHTKSLRFWEWCIAQAKADDPDVVFLAEAFTRPKVMYDLAKRGFGQSYTYFTWRQQRWEIEEYYNELTTPPVVDFFRPNAWPNTPDILTEQLQYGGRSVFVQRLVLAATLCASYGIYGPAFELMEHVAREPGSEEYLDSEKYQLRHWDVGRDDSLRELIARVNRIRRDNPALQTDRHLHFHPVDNPQLIAYSKRDDDGDNTVLTVVNLDPHWPQSGWIHLDLEALGIPDDAGAIQMHDQLGNAVYLWHGRDHFVELDPRVLPAHVFVVRHRGRTEQDFPYFV